MGQSLERLVSPVSNLSLFLSFSLSLPLLFRLIPMNVEAHRVYLFALASKTDARESPRRGTLRYPSGCRRPNVDGTSSLSWNFIGLLCKPSCSASFLH